MLPTFSIPPVGPKQAKIWGNTQLLFAHYGVECHLVNFCEGGYCSRHRHEHKWNRFVVIEGSMIVRIFREGGIVDETLICQGQVTDVPPGVWHQFEGKQNGKALELYWVVLEDSDIERNGMGGTS